MAKKCLKTTVKLRSKRFNWWLVSPLSGCFWLFALEFWEVAETVLCHSMNAGSVVGPLKTYLIQNNLFELFALTGSGDTKTMRPICITGFTPQQFSTLILCAPLIKYLCKVIFAYICMN